MRCKSGQELNQKRVKDTKTYSNRFGDCSKFHVRHYKSFRFDTFHLSPPRQSKFAAIHKNQIKHACSSYFCILQLRKRYSIEPRTWGSKMSKLLCTWTKLHYVTLGITSVTSTKLSTATVQHHARIKMHGQISPPWTKSMEAKDAQLLQGSQPLVEGHSWMISNFDCQRSTVGGHFCKWVYFAALSSKYTKFLAWCTQSGSVAWAVKYPGSQHVCQWFWNLLR